MPPQPRSVRDLTSEREFNEATATTYGRGGSMTRVVFGVRSLVKVPPRAGAHVRNGISLAPAVGGDIARRDRHAAAARGRARSPVKIVVLNAIIIAKVSPMLGRLDRVPTVTRLTAADLTRVSCKHLLRRGSVSSSAGCKGSNWQDRRLLRTPLLPMWGLQ